MRELSEEVVFELYEKAHKELVYDPIEGTLKWGISNKKHKAGDTAQVITNSSKAKRIYLNSLTYGDGVIAYLMVHKTYSVRVARRDHNIYNLKLDNLYIPKGTPYVVQIGVPATLREIMGVFSGHAVSTKDISTSLSAPLEEIQEKLFKLEAAGLVSYNNRSWLYSVTAKGHQAIMRGGDLREVMGVSSSYLFQKALSGNLTGNMGPKVLLKSLR